MPEQRACSITCITISSTTTNHAHRSGASATTIAHGLLCLPPRALSLLLLSSRLLLLPAHLTHRPSLLLLSSPLLLVRTHHRVTTALRRRSKLRRVRTIVLSHLRHTHLHELLSLISQHHLLLDRQPRLIAQTMRHRLLIRSLELHLPL